MARNRIHNFLDKRKAVTTERLWNELVGEVLAKELESELPKLLPELTRDDLDRIRETW